MLRHALEGRQYAVIEATDEVEATAALQEHRPAVVLTDLRLPRGDGFGVLRAAKELRSGPRIVDSVLSEISTGFQAAVFTATCSKYTASGVRRSSAV